MSESGSYSEVHPLFNPLILGRIFSFLQIQSLKNARLTCKTWRKEVLPYLQKSSKVVLIRGGKAELDHYSFGHFLDLLTTFSEENPIPFENYYLDHWAVNEKREKSLKQFWTACGPSMKSLHLSNVIFYEIETIRNLLYRWTPNLETLTVEDCLFYTITDENNFSQLEEAAKSEDFDSPDLSYDYYDHVTVEQLKDIPRCEEIENINANLVEISYDQLEEEEFPLSWDEIFVAFPNIHRVNVACTTRSDQISKIIGAMSNVRQTSSTLGTVTELTFFPNEKPDCPMSMNDRHLYQISDIVCLPLTSLSIMITESMKLEAITNLVRQYSPVLKKLCIYPEKEGIVCSDLLKFQRFPSLRKLCTSKEIVGDDCNFLERMPLLKTFSLWLAEEEFNWEADVDDVIMKSGALQKYTSQEMREISFGYKVSAQLAVTSMCSWFKNLTVLRMALTDESIRIVFRELTSLEEIIVFDRYLTDSGITGNPKLLSGDSTWSSKCQREHPYIGDLKKLWKFSLTFRRYEKITDLSVYQGFMDVPSLSSVLLTRTKIGDQALRDLSMKPSMIRLVTPTVSKGVELEYGENFVACSLVT